MIVVRERWDFLEQKPSNCEMKNEEPMIGPGTDFHESDETNDDQIGSNQALPWNPLSRCTMTRSS